MTRPLEGVSLCFDLDGTLVDTAPDLIRVTNEIIALEGLPPTDYDLARSVVSLGSRRLIADALGRANYTVTDERIDALQADFLKRYSKDIAQQSEPYDGVEETLKQLKLSGAALSVCTNKPGWLARPLIEALSLSDYFDRVVGGDEAPRSKPDPSHIFAAAGHKIASCIVMIGDSYPDMEAARRAGVFSVLMTYGYSHQPLEQLRADTRLRNFRDLVPTLMDWSDRRRNADDVSS